MIRFIAVLDSKRGMANEQGIPWQGKLPTDIKFFRDNTKHNNVLMGFVTYREFDKPLSDRANYVAIPEPENLRPGFRAATDARQFLKDAKDDIWVIGGAGLFESTLDLADELYLTLLEGDFKCTKFFPAYEDKFELISKSEPYVESGIIFYFTVWRRKA